MKAELIYKGNGVFILQNQNIELTENATYVTDLTILDQRSKAQNRLIHQFMKNIANRLNESDLKVQDVIKYETDWNTQKVKELIFRPVQESLYKKKSTTKLNKNELDLIFDTIIQALASKGIDTANLIKE